MKATIIPTVLANTEQEFDARLRKLMRVADELQIDIMDGKFVPSMSIPLHRIPEVKRWDKRFEAHLMVQDPGAYIQPLARRGINRIIFHIEPLDERAVRNIIALCRKYGMGVAIAINPETPVDRLLPYAQDVDGVLFLGVHPGFNGAQYVPSTPGRIREFVRKSKNPAAVIQVDGGMTPQTVAGVVAAGATRINSGSFVSNAPDPALALKQLYAAVRDIPGPRTMKAVAGRTAKPAEPAARAKPAAKQARPAKMPAKPAKPARIVKTKPSRWASKRGGR